MLSSWFHFFIFQDYNLFHRGFFSPQTSNILFLLLADHLAFCVIDRWELLHPLTLIHQIYVPTDDAFLAAKMEKLSLFLRLSLPLNPKALVSFFPPTITHFFSLDHSQEHTSLFLTLFILKTKIDHFMFMIPFNYITQWYTYVCMRSCDPMDCSPPGSSVHEDLQAKNTGVDCHSILQESPNSRDQTQSPALQADSLPSEPHTHTHIYIWWSETKHYSSYKDDLSFPWVALSKWKPSNFQGST